MSEERGKSATGARGDFVAHLGRRVAELRHGIALWEAEGASTRLRDDLRRRAHALGSAARVLRFAGMAERLGAVTSMIDQIAPTERLPAAAMMELRAAVDELPALAWGDAGRPGGNKDGEPDGAPPSTPVPLSQRASPTHASPAVVLVVGPESLAQALDGGLGDREEGEPFECERTEDRTIAVDLARAVAPDVIVLDGDLDGAQEIASRMVHDPLTEQVPLVVVATLRNPAEASLWLASGADDVLAKPIVRERLRAACRDVRARGRASAMPARAVGDATLQDVVTRLEAELRRGLLDAVPERARQIPIPLGEGHDLLAALWSTVARVREVIGERSSGMVRFDTQGPEGTVPIASWSGRDLGSVKEVDGSPDDAPSPPRLVGRSVLVADDDPAVTWFLTGVLRAAGAEVFSAPDGETALGIAYRASPDLVISDVLMPKLDGFALCRALKRDVALRDVPVILLSWKEDLLQRVRELGATADGYLRKEASGSVVLERAEEVLRPRARVEARLRLTGDVQGRLDGLTVPTLLRLVARHRPDARVTIRDACYIYEIELHEGAPSKLRRTDADGELVQGPALSSTVLGVSAGRFVVATLEPMERSPSRSAGDAEWGERLSLDQWLQAAVAKIRAAQRLLSGASLLEVREVGIDLRGLGPYLTVMPEPSRLSLVRLADGESPFELIRKSNVPPRLLEDVLADAAAHGGITKVVGGRGEDALTAAIEAEEAVLRRGITASLLPPALREEAPTTVRAPSSGAPSPQFPRPGSMPKKGSLGARPDDEEAPAVTVAMPAGVTTTAARRAPDDTAPATRVEGKRLDKKDKSTVNVGSRVDESGHHLADRREAQNPADPLEDDDDGPAIELREKLPSWSRMPAAKADDGRADLSAVFEASESPRALQPVAVVGGEGNDADELRASLMPPPRNDHPIATTSRVPTLRPPPAPPAVPAPPPPRPSRPSQPSLRLPPPPTSQPKLPVAASVSVRPPLLSAERLREEVLAQKASASGRPESSAAAGAPLPSFAEPALPSFEMAAAGSGAEEQPSISVGPEAVYESEPPPLTSTPSPADDAVEVVEKSRKKASKSSKKANVAPAKIVPAEPADDDLPAKRRVDKPTAAKGGGGSSSVGFGLLMIVLAAVGVALGRSCGTSPGPSWVGGLAPSASGPGAANPGGGVPAHQRPTPFGAGPTDVGMAGGPARPERDR
jgi:DNA-binding response OmpR family regulator